MKKELSSIIAKVIYSKDEIGYQEVLDGFSSATEIIIVTYNISERRNELLNALYSVKDDCKITVVTNIPSRWEKYYGDNYKKRAKATIDLYLSKLNPEKLGIRSSVLFDFSNHGKIIMTNNIVYIGSANFSDESASNAECGIISRDEKLIKFVNSEILSQIQKTAVPYYEYDYTALLLEANVALSAINNIKNELFDDTHDYYSEFYGEGFYYNKYEARLSIGTVECIINIINEVKNIVIDICNALDEIYSGDDDKICPIISERDALEKICNQIEEICCYDTIRNLAAFDAIHYMEEKLEGEFYPVAYEETLEHYAQIAADDASELLQDLAEKAHDDIDHLISQIDKLIVMYINLLNEINSQRIKKVNPIIDNTV